ncbi:OLC1v1026572C1 [Oldenlandia corymbosa var. corymbosa]|uniref:OLC1v1026572C1 n=1 Tax=Oldenlandia corymbosa var. corymbosa TaxID=529605 RepID=A0AAV1C7N3_OLDCO|nr:OLC1v1026572C1 [Oldenlandia corymbosa var. corymbosa]
MAQINDPSSSNAYGSPTPLLSCLSDDIQVQQEQDTGEGAAAQHLVHKIADRNIANQACSLVLAFSNLTYEAKISCKLNWSFLPRFNMINKEPAETKVLLYDISGEAYEGQILAVMGASGSGKSTLIDALANRISKGSLKGLITLNGEPFDSRLLKTISAYVRQDDLLFPMLTVEETITFAAELRLPRGISKIDKKKRVEDLIVQLDLSDCAQTIIGDEGHRGVSGGQRKRVSIGIEIIHDPIILFLDEPITGLDSTSAYAVVKVLQRIAETGSIVIMSVHQPSFRILNLMDQLLILSKGQIVYGGSPSDLPLFMENLGHPVPRDENPAEAILDLICDLENSSDGTSSLVDYNRMWEKKEDHTTRSAAVERPSGTATKVPEFANPCWIEVWVLAKRSLLNSFRMPEVFASRFVVTLATGLIVASLCWRLDQDSLQGNEDKLKALAFVTISILFLTGDGAAMLFLEKNIMLRETSHNVYRKSSYALSEGLTWIPCLLILSLTYSAITFWGIGFGDGLPARFCIYSAIVLAELWAANSYLMIVVGLFPDATAGLVVLVATVVYFFFFSGALINRDHIPAYWIWYHYLSPAKYAYDAFLQTEFVDSTRCYSRAIESFDHTKLAGVSQELKQQVLRGFGEVLGMNITASKCMRTGAQVLKLIGADDLSIWASLLINFAWSFFFRVLFFVILLFSGNLKRK